MLAFPFLARVFQNVFWQLQAVVLRSHYIFNVASGHFRNGPTMGRVGAGHLGHGRISRVVTSEESWNGIGIMYSWGKLSTWLSVLATLMPVAVQSVHLTFLICVHLLLEIWK